MKEGRKRWRNGERKRRSQTSMKIKKKSEGPFTQRDSHMPEACEHFSVAHDFNP